MQFECYKSLLVINVPCVVVVIRHRLQLSQYTLRKVKEQQWVIARSVFCACVPVRVPAYVCVHVCVCLCPCACMRVVVLRVFETVDDELIVVNNVAPEVATLRGPVM